MEAPQVQRIGRYEVVRKIATGGMAELFLARYSGPGGFEKRCALKRILPQYAADQTFTRMFLTEAKVTAQLDHPNIVQIFELGQDDNGQYFIAMEMVNGVNLRQLLTMAKERQQPVPPALAAYLATQALEGLTYAHELRGQTDGEPLNLVHRDISPHNLLVSYEGTVKLVDFGIVKGSQISSDTQSGLLKGKVAYMSPEQATGEPLDGRSDLFSLAVVLYELIGGERPFSGVNELMLLKAILEKPPRPLPELAPDCPEGIEQAISRGLAKYPEERFDSARAFHWELDNVLRGCPVPLGRHVVAEYLQSLMEGSTVRFDAQRLKIPRRGTAGFAHQIPDGQPDPHRPFLEYEAAPTEASPVPVSPPTVDGLPVRQASGSGAPVRTQSLVEAQASTEVASAPMPAATVDLEPAELRAAGVGRTPWIIIGTAMALIASWVIGWVWTGSDVDAVMVSPDEPVPRVESIDPAPAPALAPSEPARPPPTKSPASPAAKPPATTAREKVNKPAPVTGRLQLRTTPAGITVRRGARRLGETPLTVQLPPGTHALVLRSRRRGIARKLTVSISKDKTTEKVVTFKKGTVQVVSRPWAEIFLNGKAVGTTPANLKMYEGRHELKLVSPDGDERIQTLRIRPGTNPLVRVIF